MDSNTDSSQPASHWQPINTAPLDDTVLVFLAPIQAIDLCHQCSERERWVSGSGTVWPPGVCTHWMPLPPAPSGFKEHTWTTES